LFSLFGFISIKLGMTIARRAMRKRDNAAFQGWQLDAAIPALQL
jgi:hypothetical protein